MRRKAQQGALQSDDGSIETIDEDKSRDALAGAFGVKMFYMGPITYLHLLKDGRTIVGDNDLSVWGDKHFVHALGSERRLHHRGDCACGHDVNLFAESAS